MQIKLNAEPQLPDDADIQAFTGPKTIEELINFRESCIVLEVSKKYFSFKGDPISPINKVEGPIESSKELSPLANL